MTSTNPVGAASTAAPAAAGTIGTAAGSASQAAGYSTATTVSSMSELQEVAPDVYNSMLQGVALTIINQSQHEQERLKQEHQKAREDAGES